MQSLAILYGVFEGPLISKAIVAECQRRGYKVVSDASKADVIVAHSGGWMFLPKNSATKRIILIDPGFKSQKSFMHKFLGRIAYDFRHIVFTHLFSVWLLHRALNNWYFVTRFPTWVEMGRRYNTLDITPLIRQSNVTVIQSDDLSWCDGETMAHAHNFVQLDEGCHDNCWIHPAAYVEIFS